MSVREDHAAIFAAARKGAEQRIAQAKALLESGDLDADGIELAQEIIGEARDTLDEIEVAEREHAQTDYEDHSLGRLAFARIKRRARRRRRELEGNGGRAA